MLRSLLCLSVLAGAAVAQPCPPPPVAAGWLAVPYAPGVGKHGHSYDAHDCEVRYRPCNGNLDPHRTTQAAALRTDSDSHCCCALAPALQCYDNTHKMRAQCQVVGDTVHLAGTVQCAPGDSHCFGDATGVDTDVFATLPAPCRPTSTAYTPMVELISEQPLVNPAASVRITVQTTGDMFVSGSSITCQVRFASKRAVSLTLEVNCSRPLQSRLTVLCATQDKPNCPFLKWCMLINTSFPIRPSPPPPLSSSPCIRFGHAIPVDNHVDVEISQQQGSSSITHTWSDYAFGSFSDWTNVFRPGTGQITVWENVGGKRGAQLYQLQHIPLTPGPLVVVLKVAASQAQNVSGYWPPNLPDAIETIAASCVGAFPKPMFLQVTGRSHCCPQVLLCQARLTVCTCVCSARRYVQGANTSKVRLFNLSPDTKGCGMTVGGVAAASNIPYSLGSAWLPVPATPGAFTFTDSTSKKTLVTKTVTPPAAPLGFTNVLLGLQNGAGDLGVKVVSLVDAPEGGTCHP